MQIDSDDKELIDVVSLICKALKKNGVKKVVGALAKIQPNMSNSLEDKDQQVLDFICFKIFDAYQTSLKELRESNKRGKIKKAKRLAYVLFNKHLSDSFSQRDIGLFWHSNASSVNVAIKAFSQLNKDNKNGREILMSFERINKEINAFKENLILKYSN